MTEQALNTLNFEAALQELEKIVRDLETGRAPLEQSISLYERGIELKKHCEAKLKEAQEKIEKITVARDGNITAAPLDPVDNTN